LLGAISDGLLGLWGALTGVNIVVVIGKSRGTLDSQYEERQLKRTQSIDV
jgi:hypothetical protein